MRILLQSILRSGTTSQKVLFMLFPDILLSASRRLPISLQLAEEKHIPVRIIEGLSFIEPSLTALSYDALDGLQIVGCAWISQHVHHPPLIRIFRRLIAQVYSRTVASNLKLVLMNQYPDEHPVVMVDGAGTAHARKCLHYRYMQSTGKNVPRCVRCFFFLYRHSQQF